MLSSWLKKRNGFTLVEIMIVIAIIGIIVVVVFPSYENIKSDWALYSEARKLKENLRYMQQLAMSVQQTCWMEFTESGYSIHYGSITDRSFKFENSVSCMAGPQISFNKRGIPEGFTGTAVVTLTNSVGSKFYVKVWQGGKIDVSAVP